MKKILPILVLLLISTAFAATDSVSLLNEDENSFSSAINGWTNVTIRAVVSGATSTAANVTSSTDTDGIQITLTDQGSDTYEGWFLVGEKTSSADDHIIEVDDGDTVSVSVDLDEDGSAGTNSVSYDDDPDEIFSYESSIIVPNTGTQQDKFNLGDTVYLTIISEKNNGGTVTVTGDTSASVTMSESVDYPGFYTGSFVINDDVEVSAGGTITITSDLEGDDETDSTKTIDIWDDIEILETSDKSSVTEVNAWDDLTVRVKNDAANTDNSTIQSGSVTINSTTDGTGITVTVTETDVDTGIFEGTFNPSEKASDDSNDYIQSTDNGTIYAYADLDGDGTSVVDNVTYKINPDEIITRKTAAGASSLYFKDGDTVYVNVYAMAGASSPSDITVTSDSDSTGISVSVTEDGTHDGKYTATFSIGSSSVEGSTIEASTGDTITISADVDDGETGGADSPDTTLNIYYDETAPSSAIVKDGENTLLSDPDQDYLKSSDEQKIKVTITDNLYTANSITLHYKLGSGGSWTQTSTSLCTVSACGYSSSQGGTTTYYATIDDTSVDNGDSVYLYVTGTDEAGNSITSGVGGSTSSELANYVIDDLPPTIDTLEINGASSSPTVDKYLNLTIEWNATDSADITEAYYTVRKATGELLQGWNKTITVPSSSCTASSCTNNQNAMDMETGDLNLTLFAKDQAGNWVNQSLVFDSRAFVEVVDTTVVNTSVSNSGSGEYVVEFELDLKGSYVKFKIDEMSLSSNSSITFNPAGDTQISYTNTNDQSKTWDVGSTYGSTNPDTMKDLSTTTPYLRDITLNMTIDIPTALYPGDYSGAYYIGAY